MYKKILIFFLILLGIIIISTNLIRFSSTKLIEPLSPIPTNIPTETDLVLGLKKTIENKVTLQLKIKEDDTCYWAKPTHNGTHHLLQINKYKNALEECIGFVENRNYILREKGLNILGDTCVCSGRTYSLERDENKLKISLMNG